MVYCEVDASHSSLIAEASLQPTRGVWVVPTGQELPSHWSYFGWGLYQEKQLSSYKIGEPQIWNTWSPFGYQRGNLSWNGIPIKSNPVYPHFSQFPREIFVFNWKTTQSYEITGFYPTAWPGMHWQPIGIRQEMTPMPSLFSGISCNQKQLPMRSDHIWPALSQAKEHVVIRMNIMVLRMIYFVIFNGISESQSFREWHETSIFFRWILGRAGCQRRTEISTSAGSHAMKSAIGA